MLRRSVLTEAQRADLLALPNDEAALVRHGTLRAGDMWVEGSRRYRAVEQQLIPAPVFAAMRDAGPLPVPVADTAMGWLAEGTALLARRLAEVGAKIASDTLEDVQLANGRLRISPLRAITPDEAEGVLAPLYAHLPSIRIPDLLADVDRWTGLTHCFTHLTTGRPHDDPRAILTAVLADATNLGHARMAEACGLVTQHQLGWLSAWHLREGSYGAALARLAEAQHRMPLAAMFGSGTASSSDGQNFPLDRRAQATGAINPHRAAIPPSHSTRTSPIATRRSIPGSSLPVPAKRHMSSTACSTTARISRSSATIPLGAASPIMSSRCATCSASVSRRASRTSLPGACTCSPTRGPDRTSLRWRHSRSTRR
ncbi:hypothetical protein SPHINGO8AM_70114 [Sphingomonas sp. 8AM]|nr:hypothetical protein SPHINGO8AM_70114 [Sphingomonas sp. 8AM]